LALSAFGFSGGASAGELAVPDLGHLLIEFGQQCLIDGISASLRITERPYGQRRMIACGALVLLAPGDRVLREKAESAFNRGLECRRIGRFSGQGSRGTECEGSEEERAHSKPHGVEIRGLN
jgi:hypothetical protein